MSLESLRNSRVFRCGQTKTPAQSDDWEMLRNFWELEEQLGIRKIPTDNIMAGIPKIHRSAPSHKPVDDIPDAQRKKAPPPKEKVETKVTFKAETQKPKPHPVATAKAKAKREAKKAAKQKLKE